MDRNRSSFADKDFEPQSPRRSQRLFVIQVRRLIRASFLVVHKESIDEGRVYLQANRASESSAVAINIAENVLFRQNRRRSNNRPRINRDSRTNSPSRKTSPNDRSSRSTNAPDDRAGAGKFYIRTRPIARFGPSDCSSASSSTGRF